MNKKRKEIIDRTAEYVRSELLGEGAGHDWWHVYRVWKTATTIAKEEKADQYVVQLAALLHDIADWKFHGGDEKAGSKKAKEWLEYLKVDEQVIVKVCGIIDDVSFKGAGVGSKIKSIEGKVVQDADRLDAMGAIGIGRTFAYGGYKQREMYNPNVKVKMAKNFEEYKNAGQTTINHFYEKLLLLKDRINTKTGKKMAEGRHRFMEEYLERFFAEWEGKNESN
jgi:uncharacterized protein